MFKTNVLEKMNRHILCTKIPPPLEIVSFMRSCGKKFVERVRPQMTIWLMRTACWISKATNTYTRYVILNCFSTVAMVARTRSSVPLYVHCLSCFLVVSTTPRFVGFHSGTKFGGRHIGLISVVVCSCSSGREGELPVTRIAVLLMGF
jgi:hypothetical protein